MAEATAPMKLLVLTPAGTNAEAGCDSAVLTIRDGADGRGGGLVGIRKDHAPAVFALSDGEIRASLGGETVFRASVRGGFASVRDNIIRVITDSAELRPL